jgi:hypothetical protein
MTPRLGIRTALGRALALAALGAATAAAPASACDDPANLVPNCGFDTDPSGWTFIADSTDHVLGDGSSAPGCVELDRHDVTQGFEVFSACLDVDPSTTYKLAIAARVFSGPGPAGCVVSFVEHSSADCNSFVAEPFLPVIFGTSWRRFLWSRTTAATTQSARLRLACNGATDFTARVDDGEVVPAVFADGFEAGTAAAWSLTVP